MPIDRIDRYAHRFVPREFNDRIATALQGRLGRTFEASPDGQRVQRVLHGWSWLGHPLHPLLTAIVTGAWTVAWVFDLLETVGIKRFRSGATGAIALGLLAVPPTAATGATDWQPLSGSARRVGLIHAKLNSLAATCYIISLIQRLRGRRASGHLWGHIGFAIVNASAYLGGELAYHAAASVEDELATAPLSEEVEAAAALATDQASSVRASATPPAAPETLTGRYA